MLSKAEKTKQFILQQTAPLFNMKGFEGTSMADLIGSTGLTKGALYGNFHNKEDLAMEAFKYAVGRVKELVKERVDRETTYKRQLRAMLDFFAEYVFHPPVAGGCPLLNTAVQADDQFPGMRRVVVKELMSTVMFIYNLLNKGIQAGEFRKDINARELAYTIFCSVEGAIMFSRAERSEEPMKIIIKHCKKLINEISI
ncbi:MAG: TetR/AcrR family transcriptional regulator [Cyclobacteriaceae bacterium]|nr:TetR/AcrR family transcriptional regulator [Cyclobacteriaceae bacterium]